MKALLFVLRRSLSCHKVGFGLTILTVALSFTLCLGIFSLHRQSKSILVMENLGFDAVLGARGSALQLVLSSIYHLEASPGNLPWEIYKNIKDHPGVEHAVPFATGDNYKGYRIVGTLESFFSLYGGGVNFKDGGPFLGGDQMVSEKPGAVLGSTVAQETGRRVGDLIHPYHGLVFDEGARHDNTYKVVGVMEPTNTPADRVVWIPIDGFYRLGGHVLMGSGETYQPEAGVEIPDAHKEVSAVLLSLKNPMFGMMLDQTINRQGTVATLAFPIAKEVLVMYKKMGWVLVILQGVALLSLIVSATGSTAAITNTLHERRREFAILRAIGARRRHLLFLVLGQSVVLCLAGVVVGLGLYAVMMFFVVEALRENIGLHFSIFFSHEIFWQLPVGTLLLGCLAGLIPATLTYREDVAANLNE
jgi:putative ABC transport system permease protein